MAGIKILLLIAILISFPLLFGILLCRALQPKREQFLVPELYLGGMLGCGLCWGSFAFMCNRMQFSLQKVTGLMLIAAIFFVFLCIILICRFSILKRDCVGAFRSVMRIPDKSTWLVLAAFLLVAGTYSLGGAFLQETGHDTLEQVVTMVDTGKIAGYDALTGEEMPVDGNWRKQICNLPLFYACLCRASGLSPAMLLFDVVPYVVLAGAFCMVLSFVSVFGIMQRERQAIALIVFALITVCGNTAYMNTSYCLLHYPYEGWTVFSSIYLPLAFVYGCQRKQLVFLLLTYVNAVFMVGLLGALPILALQAVGLLFSFACLKMSERRKA